MLVRLKGRKICSNAASVEGENYKEALEGFRKVVELEIEKGEW